MGASGEYNAFPSEGGHCDFGPRNELEFDLLQFSKHNYNRHRISYERIVSGRGIYEVYEFFAQREPKKVLKEVTEARRSLPFPFGLSRADSGLSSGSRLKRE